MHFVSILWYNGSIAQRCRKTLEIQGKLNFICNLIVEKEADFVLLEVRFCHGRKVSMKIVFVTDRQFRDLNPVALGHEACVPGKFVSNYPRRYTVIHYVHKGKGILKNGKRSYHIKAGEAFIIMEGETVSYTADKKDPWEYTWVCFNGELSMNFSELPVVFPHSADIFNEMLSIEHAAFAKESYLAGLLFKLHSEIEVNDRQATEYVKKIINIINQNYMYDLRVEKIADEMNLNRHYISSLFKKETGKSILEYLIFVRLGEAKRYLAEGKGVTETAGLVGYTDSSTFSKIFKKYCGVPPIKYRKTAEYYASEHKRRRSMIYNGD